MSRPIQDKQLRVIRDLLQDLAAPRSECSEAFRFRAQDVLPVVLDALEPKRHVQLARVRRQEGLEQDHLEWCAIREKVFARAGVKEPGEFGFCEHCKAWTQTLQPDHMFGGSDRRMLQSVFTVWALCATCHRQKTNEQPSRNFWLKAFIAHALQMMTEHSDVGYRRAADLCESKLEAEAKVERAAAITKST